MLGYGTFPLRVSHEHVQALADLGRRSHHYGCGGPPIRWRRAKEVGERCWQDVKVLADDSMEGRRAGSEGHRKAANYVAEEFRKAGLKPGGDAGGFLQSVPLEVRQIDEPKSSIGLVIDGQPRPLKFGDDAGLSLRGNYYAGGGCAAGVRGSRAQTTAVRRG